MKGLLSNIVVVISGAESSIPAMKYALALGRAWGSELTALYTVDTHSIAQLAATRVFVEDEVAEFERNLEDSGRRYLSYVEELAREKSVKVRTILRKGSVVDEALKTVTECGADGIIIGGWDQLNHRGNLLAEENREIARTAPCPVVIVKGQAADLAFKNV